MNRIRKYPRTHHLEGSRLQPGDEDLHSSPFSALKGRFLVVEEKIDGANSGISFDAAGKLWLQSRGHYLTGGVREKHFNLFKQWAAAQAQRLWPVLADRFVMYGEWVYAKHTIFYDQLPHFFLEFDILDTQTCQFLATARRRQLLAGLPIASVPVLWTGVAESLEQLLALVGPSLYKSADWRQRLRQICGERNLDAERIDRETDAADDMEGLYLKVEEPAGTVVDRYKWIRASFLTSVVAGGSHWLSRPIVLNQLRSGIDLFGGQS